MTYSILYLLVTILSILKIAGVLEMGWLCIAALLVLALAVHLWDFIRISIIMLRMH
jgi:hypothetical protein